MIHTMIKSMADGVKYIKEAATSNEFADAIHAICTYMKLCCMHIIMVQLSRQKFKTFIMN